MNIMVNFLTFIQPGIVPIESMYCRVPVVACNSGGPRETVKNGVTGFLTSGPEVNFSL